MFGDRWSLLIIRDLMVRGFRTFKDFLESGEGIATNILADRLHRLEALGITIAESEETDRRKLNYRLTEKGIDLAPVLLDLLIWAARHEQTAAPCELTAQMEKNREAFLEEVRRRWRERDLTPLIPSFRDSPGRGKVRAWPRAALRHAGVRARAESPPRPSRASRVSGSPVLFRGSLRTADVDRRFKPEDGLRGT
jgi:DNA-binding HxlR family transcriptional regulator